MPKDELILIKRYKYDVKRDYDKDETEYTWSLSENAYVLDAYQYNLNTYIVRTYWNYEGSGDMVDSDHYEYLSLTVFPIKLEDINNIEKVNEIVSKEKGHNIQIGDRPRVNIKNEESFTSSNYYHVLEAINSYLANKKKEEALKENPLPNVIFVSTNNTPKSCIIYDFDSHASLGTLFYNCTSVCIKPLDEKSQKLIGVNRPLCYFYPANRGAINVYAYIYEKSGEQKIIVSKENKFYLGDSCGICSYDNSKPGPLTPEEVQKILDFVNKK